MGHRKKEEPNYNNGNNYNFYQKKELEQIMGSNILARYESVKRSLNFEVVPIDPTAPSTTIGQLLLAFTKWTEAITSGTLGLLEAGKHNSLPTNTNHHQSTSVNSSYVTPNLLVKQRSPTKSGKTLNTTTKIIKQVKAINQDEPSSSYSEENDQQSVIRVERSADNSMSSSKLVLNYKTINSKTAKLFGETLKDTSINTLTIQHPLELSRIKDTNINKLILRKSNLDLELVVTLVTTIRDNCLNITELDVSGSYIEPKTVQRFLNYLKHGTKFTFAQDNTKVTITIDGNTEDNLLETSATPEIYTTPESYTGSESYTAPEKTVSKEGILWGIIGGVGTLALSGFGLYKLYKKFFGNEKVEESLGSHQNVNLELRDSPPPPYDDNDPTYEPINLDSVYIIAIPRNVYNEGDTSSTFANATANIDNSCYNVKSAPIPLNSSSQEVTTRTNISDTNDVGYDTAGPGLYYIGIGEAQEPQEPITYTALTNNSIPNTNNGDEYETPNCKPIYVNITEVPQGDTDVPDNSDTDNEHIIPRTIVSNYVNLTAEVSQGDTHVLGAYASLAFEDDGGVY